MLLKSQPTTACYLINKASHPCAFIGTIVPDLSTRFTPEFLSVMCPMMDTSTCARIFS